MDLMRKKSVISIVFICLMIFIDHGVSQNIMINEFMADNTKTIKDDQGDYDDWVEIYNAGTSPADLGGMYFGNDPEKPAGWQIPDTAPGITTIKPGGHLVFWFDKDTAKGLLHVNLKIDKDGSRIILCGHDKKTIIDEVIFNVQKKDISYGRIPDGSDKWRFMNNPSPGKPCDDKGSVKGTSPDPVFSHKEGFYNNSIKLEISSPVKNTHIYYTIDGSNPEEKGNMLYSEPIDLDSTTVIKTRAFTDNYFPGKIITKTYFINDSSCLPAVSLSITPGNLYDKKTGIMTNPRAKDIKPAWFEYYNTEGKKYLSMGLGIKPAGNASLSLPKKSFTLDSKKKYGNSRIKYKFFDDRQADSFGGLLLRTGNIVSLLRSALICEVNRSLNNPVDMQAYKPVSMFLNGKYQGIYFLMERKGRDFININYGTKKVDIIEKLGFVVAGDAKDYTELISFIKNNDFTDDSVFNILRKKTDISNLTDFWIYEIYTSKGDSYGNIRCWKERSENGRWRWIGYDYDWWVGYNDTSLFRHTISDKVEKYIFLGKILENTGYRNTFINRMADMLNTVFLPENLDSITGSLIQGLGNEIKKDILRWNLNNFDESLVLKNHEISINSLKEFIDKRPSVLREQIITRFCLKGSYGLTVSVSPESGGYIKINTIGIRNYPWNGIYFTGVPVTITAIPEEGWEFTGWSDNAIPAEPEIRLTPENDLNITAIFSRK